MSETIYLGTDEIRLSAGKFRTTRRYLRASSATGAFAMVRGRSLEFAIQGGGAVLYRYSVAGYVVEPVASATGFDADAETVKA